MSVHPDFYMRFRNFPEQDLDNLTEDHKNGDCPENCMLCAEEQYEREQYERNLWQRREDQKKAQACADAFKPLLQLETEANLKAAKHILDDFEIAFDRLFRAKVKR